MNRFRKQPANPLRELEAQEQSAWKELRREERRLDDLHAAGAWWDTEAQAARVARARERHQELWDRLTKAQWDAEAAYDAVRRNV